MLYSRLPAFLRRALILLFMAQLSACGSGGHNASAIAPTTEVATQSTNANVSIADTYNLSLDVSDGGYVIDDNLDLLCAEEVSFCDTDVDVDDQRTLNAVSRVGYAFIGWNNSGNQSQTLNITVSEDTNITASFQQTSISNSIADSASCENSSTSKFRALHLGDSLTAGPIYANEYGAYLPEVASIAFYQQKADTQITAPLVVVKWNILIAGVRNDNLAQALPENHFWKQEIANKKADIDDFSAVVVALGSNDAVDIMNGLDPDFVIEQRVKPLLKWLGNKPVYWILPHYARWPTAMQNIRFSGKSDGLDCSCNNGPGNSSTQCNIVDEMQHCSVAQDQQQQTITAFRAIHALRERLAALQDGYPNLIVVDAVQTIATISDDQYDLYATLSRNEDTIHFSRQGSEWYGWLHAWLALHADSNCDIPALPKWQMGAAEIDMATQLNSTI